MERKRTLLQTNIEIHAPVERVWSIPTYFSAYGQWNPFIVSARGGAVAGERLRIIVQPGAGPRYPAGNEVNLTLWH